MPQIPRASSCCGCIDLSLGVKIIAVLQILLGALGDFIFPPLLGFIKRQFGGHTKEHNKVLEWFLWLVETGAYIWILIAGIVLAIAAFSSKKDKARTWIYLISTFLTIAIVVCIIRVILLILGLDDIHVLDFICLTLLHVYFLGVVNGYVHEVGLPGNV